MWWDFYKIFIYAFSYDPLSKKDKESFNGAGTSQLDAIPDLRAGGGSGGNSIQLRDSNEFVDLSTVTNRLHRYKEYERLRNMPEIEMAMTVFADEACLAGDTKISTPTYGHQTIKWLTENIAQGERFLVYCWDFNKSDFVIGWAFNPRKTKSSPTLKLVFDDGTFVICTKDHRILNAKEQWLQAQEYKAGDHVLAFHKVEAKTCLNNQKIGQFPRIYTHRKGWVHERQFIDEWRLDRDIEDYQQCNEICRMIVGGLSVRQIQEKTGMGNSRIQNIIENQGFSNKELKWLTNKKKETRRIVGIFNGPETDVYDLSVENHENFCTDWGVVHNCQRDEKGRVFQVNVENQEIKEELEFLLFHRKMLNLDQNNLWNKAKNLFISGDYFEEIIINPENPKEGIKGLLPLPPEGMYRIESTKGRLIEFQLSKEGPDYQSLARVDINNATEADFQQMTAIRFAPEQIIHSRIGDDRKTFYPYGVSLIEAARGPAHQLRLMEDAMVVYRLSRSPERRIFYIDVQGMSNSRAESFIERMKDQFKKKKVSRGGGSVNGASAVEERWHAPAIDEDYWLPIRPNNNTRIETLPGACLSLDSKIPLLDGTNDTLEQIIQRWNQGQELWAYSCNPQTGEMVPGLITWAGVTRKNTNVVKVTFDNGESITCTPDHKFPVIGREGKIQAKDLNIGDSLIPFRARKRKITKNTKEYRQIYDPSKKKWVYVHRMVAEYKNLVSVLVYKDEYLNSEKNVVHHINFQELNNNCSNLAWMNWIDHKCLHSDMPKREETRLKISESLTNYHDKLSDSEKQKRNQVLIEKSKLGTTKINKLLSENKDFKNRFVKSQKEGWQKALKNNPQLHEIRGQKISNYNKERFSDFEYKKSVFEKQTIKYPKSIFDFICLGFSQGLGRDDIIQQINCNKDLIDDYVAINNHIVRKDVKLEDGITRDHFDKLVKANGFSGSRELRKSLIGKIKDRSGQDNNGKIYGKSTLNFSKKIFTYFIHRLADGVKNVDDIINEINSNQELMQEWISSNSHVSRKGVNIAEGLKRTHIKRMVESYGYNSLDHARSEAHLYNHTVVSIEYLDEKIDTGTITIDGNEMYHNYHTFALSGCGIMTYNSNLGEIDDTVYFRNKLFVAMNFPKNYFNNEDVQTTRISLSAQDVKFARMVERLQSHMEDGIWEICDRHLKLRGYPEEAYEDLMIKFTPPSDWRELSKAEVVASRIQNAGSLKGSQIMSDYDILTEWMKCTEDDAKKKLARLKIQKLEELKLQIIAQNPALLGVGVPAEDEEQISTEPNEDNPMLGGDGATEEDMPEGDMPEGDMPEGGMPGGGMSGGMSGGGMPGGSSSNKGSSINIPKPSDEDIKKYNLDIKDYSQEQDMEEIDRSEM